MIYSTQILTAFGFSFRSLGPATNYVLASIFLGTLICGHAFPLTTCTCFFICLGTEVRISQGGQSLANLFPVLDDEVDFKGVPRGERWVVSETTKEPGKREVK